MARFGRSFPIHPLIKKPLLATAYTLSLSDTVTLSDVKTSSVGIVKSDSVVLSDSASKTISLTKSDVITLTDVIVKTFGLNLSDSISLTDILTASESIILSLSDIITLSETIAKVIGLNEADSLLLTDIITVPVPPVNPGSPVSAYYVEQGGYGEKLKKENEEQEVINRRRFIEQENEDFIFMVTQFVIANNN